MHLANLLNTKSILNISVYDYLWGYEDPLVKLASGIVPTLINFQEFGLLDRVSELILISFKRSTEMHSIKKIILQLLKKIDMNRYICQLKYLIANCLMPHLI